MANIAQYFVCMLRCDTANEKYSFNIAHDI